MTPNPIRVLLCDDSRSLSTLVDHWLEEHDDLEFVGAVHHGSEAVDAVERTRPDVVLLDTLGNPYDATVLNRIRRAAPAAKVIVYSGYVSLLGDAALPLTPDAFVDKGAGSAELVAAIRAVALDG
jgi:DNA-binding NarL/FixJ family response regulator